jgi:hypothetical protein
MEGTDHERRHRHHDAANGREAGQDPPDRQGRHRRQVDDDHRPQGHRQPVLHHLVRVVHPRRDHGAAHPGGAVRAGPAGRRQPRPVQPAVHHARHDHAAALRHPAVRRVRQRADAAADRVTGRRLPAAQHVRVLAVPVRRVDRRCGLPQPPGCGRVRLVRLRAALGRGVQPRARRGPVGVRARARGLRHHPRVGQLPHDDHHHAGARHDDVPDADLHVDGAHHLGPRAAHLPRPRRGAVRPRRRPALRRPDLRGLRRWADDVAAHLLVLRAPRGLRSSASSPR